MLPVDRPGQGQEPRSRQNRPQGRRLPRWHVTLLDEHAEFRIVPAIRCRAVRTRAAGAPVLPASAYRLAVQPGWSDCAALPGRIKPVVTGVRKERIVHAPPLLRL